MSAPDRLLTRFAAQHEVNERALRGLAAKAERVEKSERGEVWKKREERRFSFALSVLFRRAARLEMRTGRRERQLGLTTTARGGDES